MSNPSSPPEVSLVIDGRLEARTSIVKFFPTVNEGSAVMLDFVFSLKMLITGGVSPEAG